MPPDYLTQADVQNYGTDLVDFAQRAAAHAVAPQLQYMQEQNEKLQQQLAREAKQRIDMALDAAVPNWRASTRTHTGCNGWQKSRT